ncbi:MAG: hypothetical protein M9965_20985 [Anaerolineae bacterium]|nr:hypothetical protein [Anaerolineae bacterium]
MEIENQSDRTTAIGRNTLRSRAKAFYEGMTAVTRLETAIALTLLWLLLLNTAYSRVATLILIVVVIGLIYRSVQQKWAYWLVIVLLLWLSAHSSSYLILDEYLLGLLWCVAIFLALLTPDPDHYLAFNARILLGLLFLVTVIQKLASPGFADGGMFEASLLFDPRFRPITELFMGDATIDANGLAARLLLYFNNPLRESVLESTETLATAAKMLTWWTIGIELIIAVMFLWPKRGRLAWKRVMQWRDIPLLIFLATTYPIAIVWQFSWLLSTFGVAQTDKKWVRVLYLIVLFFSLFRAGAWISLAERILTLLPG